MGGFASTGRNNDELVENLCADGLIIDERIERVFRTVDRGHYFLESDLDDAYKDAAWRNDKFHISAPCIYCEVLKAMDIGPGKSFLNIGSGTGYFSTMVGLLLGVNSINHGIELYKEVVEHAKMKLQAFKENAPYFDWYDFCEPKFVTGNCLDISPGAHKYDLVYCGAQCPNEQIEFMKSLLNINGTLVLPHQNSLKKYVRVSEGNFEVSDLMGVSFADLVVDRLNQDEPKINMPKRSPPSLQAYSRSIVRQILRKNFLKSIPLGSTKCYRPNDDRDMALLGLQERYYIRRMIDRERQDILAESDSDDDSVELMDDVVMDGADVNDVDNDDNMNNQQQPYLDHDYLMAIINNHSDDERLSPARSDRTDSSTTSSIEHDSDGDDDDDDSDNDVVMDWNTNPKTKTAGLNTGVPGPSSTVSGSSTGGPSTAVAGTSTVAAGPNTEVAGPSNGNSGSANGVSNTPTKASGSKPGVPDLSLIQQRFSRALISPSHSTRNRNPRRPKRRKIRSAPQQSQSSSSSGEYDLPRPISLRGEESSTSSSGYDPLGFDSSDDSIRTRHVIDDDDDDIEKKEPDRPSSHQFYEAIDRLPVPYNLRLYISYGRKPNPSSLS